MQKVAVSGRGETLAMSVWQSRVAMWELPKLAHTMDIKQKDALYKDTRLGPQICENSYVWA